MVFSVGFVANFYDDQTLTFTVGLTSSTSITSAFAYHIDAEIRDATNTLNFSLMPLLKTLRKNDTFPLAPPAPNFRDVDFTFNSLGPVGKVAIQVKVADDNTNFPLGEALVIIPNVTPPSSALVPQSPMINPLTNITGNSVDVSWSFGSDGGSPLTGVRVQARVIATGARTNFNIGVVTSFTVTGLEPLTEYNVRVFASNAVGESPRSTINEFATLVAPPEDDTITTDMVTISAGGFELKNDRITGTIDFVATPQFNPFWLNKPIESFIQFRDVNDQVYLFKTQPMTFFSIGTSFTQLVNEPASGNKMVKVQFFTRVSDADIRPFSTTKEFILNDSTGCPAGMQKNPDTGMCEPIPPEPEIEEKNHFTPLIVGALALGFIGSSLLDKKQPKRRKR